MLPDGTVRIRVVHVRPAGSVEAMTANVRQCVAVTAIAIGLIVIARCILFWDQGPQADWLTNATKCTALAGAFLWLWRRDDRASR